MWPSALRCSFVPDAQYLSHINLFTESGVKRTCMNLCPKGFSVLFVCCGESLGADQEQLRLHEWFPRTYSQILPQTRVQGQCQFNAENVERGGLPVLAHFIVGSV